MMKSSILAGTVAVCAITAIAVEPVPNRVTVKTYANTEAPISTHSTHSFSDGLGRPLLSLSETGDGEIVSGTVRDGLGRSWKTIKPFYSESFGHAWAPFNLVTEANSYFNGSTEERRNAAGYAYSETEYFPNPMNRAKASSMPGGAFHLAGGKTLRTWYFSRVLPDFISNPTTAALDAMAPASSNPAGAKYLLSITRDQDGRFTQSISDAFGRVLKTWSDPTTVAGDEIVSENEYDPAGRILKKYQPGPGGAKDPTRFSSYLYSAAGQLVWEKHPDEGRTEYFYDHAGRLRASQDEKQRNDPNQDIFTYHVYDGHGRETEIGIFKAPKGLFPTLTASNLDGNVFPGQWPSVVKIRKFYDNADGVPEKTFVGKHHFTILGPSQGKLIATVTFDESGSLGSDHRVAEVFRYNDEGQLQLKKIFIPGLPDQVIGYFYDLQGRPTDINDYSYYANSSYQSTSWTYGYSPEGYLKNIKRNGYEVIRYTYSKTGLLTQRSMVKDLTGGAVYSFANQDYAYNVQDRPIDIEGSVFGGQVYLEELYYESNGAPNQYSGNVSYSAETYKVPGFTGKILLPYRYDNANRLVGTYHGTTYDEGFEYDAAGRIVKKKEGNKIYGPYEYQAGTNRVLRVPGAANRNGPVPNFIYDPNGNMVWDRSKKMRATYDWRGMPVQFTFFTSDLPEGAQIDWVYVENFSGTKRSSVSMMYDLSNKRVLKLTETF